MRALCSVGRAELHPSPPAFILISGNITPFLIQRRHGGEIPHRCRRQRTDHLQQRYVVDLVGPMEKVLLASTVDYWMVVERRYCDLKHQAAECKVGWLAIPPIQLRMLRTRQNYHSHHAGHINLEWAEASSPQE